jgi:O-antigen/teichoic acid export membrane protein
MGCSTLIRIASGLLTFATIARMLGPSDFGVLMLWLSVATLISLAVNYGFTPYALREIGANRTSATKLMSEVLTAKVLIGLTLLLIGLFGALLIESPARWVFLVFLLGMLTDSMTDFLNVGYRATERFIVETQMATFASIIQFTFITLSAYLFRDVLCIAVAFLASRLVVLTATWISQIQYFSMLSLSSFSKAKARIREASSYACDFGLQSLFGQIDSLVIHQFVGPAAVGIYQSGMRIFLAGSQAAAVVGNVFIPHAASFSDDLAARRKVNSHIVTILLTIGVIGGLVFASIPTVIVMYVFGESFARLSELLFGFGLLFFARFATAAVGTILTIQGHQKERAICTLAQWIFIAAYCVYFPLNNSSSWIIALIFSHAVLIVLYSITLRRYASSSISKLSWLKIICSFFFTNFAVLYWRV